MKHFSFKNPFFLAYTFIFLMLVGNFYLSKCQKRMEKENLMLAGNLKVSKKNNSSSRFLENAWRQLLGYRVQRRTSDSR